jgi:hypothetical protein
LKVKTTLMLIGLGDILASTALMLIAQADIPCRLRHALLTDPRNY